MEWQMKIRRRIAEIQAIRESLCDTLIETNNYFPSKEEDLYDIEFAILVRIIQFLGNYHPYQRIRETATQVLETWKEKALRRNTSLEFLTSQDRIDTIRKDKS
ncbi:hypothetical protein LWI29_010956 [Acer saccharum]|uniref:Uncharacterized protein n=1 Tax=Acer saccharum TaxID=4024 RepID=A0AA39T1M4_ACESA|nr:hypothetical protein LWI29_010956 [Acer saccharum]